MVCIHEPLTLGKSDIEVDDCLVSRVDELIQKQALIPILIKLATFMCQLRDAYYFEYEITNHNLYVNRLYVNRSMEVCLVNQILPLQYRLEYGLIMSSIYEEDQFEMNEVLLVKKFIFLLVALATDDGVKEYADIKSMLRQYVQKRLPLPQNPVQCELLKLAINLTYMLETPLERNQVCLGFVLDKLNEMDRACKRPGFGSPQGGVKYKPMAPV